MYIGHHRLPHNQKVTGQKTCKYRNNKQIHYYDELSNNHKVTGKKHVNTGITRLYKILIEEKTIIQDINTGKHNYTRY